MNDQDYIRKAVELADGFSVAPGGAYQTPRGNTAEHLVYTDALAAQLVRQVDAKPRVYIQMSDCESSIRTVNFARHENDFHTAEAHGPDRTMNTIKAIVDSGVLAPVSAEQEVTNHQQ